MHGWIVDSRYPSLRIHNPNDMYLSQSLSVTPRVHQKVRGVGFEPTKHRAHRKENPRQVENPSFNQAQSDLVTFGLWMQKSRLQTVDRQ